MAILAPRNNTLKWWCHRAALGPHLEFISIVEDENLLPVSLAEVRLDPLFHLGWLHIMKPY
jgi:hypothetical protein